MSQFYPYPPLPVDEAAYLAPLLPDLIIRGKKPEDPARALHAAGNVAMYAMSKVAPDDNVAAAAPLTADEASALLVQISNTGAKQGETQALAAIPWRSLLRLALQFVDLVLAG